MPLHVYSYTSVCNVLQAKFKKAPINKEVNFEAL